VSKNIILVLKLPT